MLNTIPPIYLDMAIQYLKMAHLNNKEEEPIYPLSILTLTIALDEKVSKFASQRWPGTVDAQIVMDRCQIAKERLQIYCRGLLEVNHKSGNNLMSWFEGKIETDTDGEKHRDYEESSDNEGSSSGNAEGDAASNDAAPVGGRRDSSSPHSNLSTSKVSSPRTPASKQFGKNPTFSFIAGLMRLQIKARLSMS